MLKNCLIILLTAIILAGNCSTSQKKVNTTQEILIVNPVMEKFFAKEPLEEEAFQVFVTSDDYVLNQVGFKEMMSISSEITTNTAMSEEIGNYDMVDLFTEAVYKVELFPDTGLIHIRPVKPSKISELNKIIIDDITRLKFKITDDKSKDPVSFKIRYGVNLRKKKSREEIKKILQENVKN